MSEDYYCFATMVKNQLLLDITVISVLFSVNFDVYLTFAEDMLRTSMSVCLLLSHPSALPFPSIVTALNMQSTASRSVCLIIV